MPFKQKGETFCSGYSQTESDWSIHQEWEGFFKLIEMMMQLMWYRCWIVMKTNFFQHLQKYLLYTHNAPKHTSDPSLSHLLDN